MRILPHWKLKHRTLLRPQGLHRRIGSLMLRPGLALDPCGILDILTKGHPASLFILQPTQCILALLLQKPCKLSLITMTKILLILGLVSVVISNELPGNYLTMYRNLRDITSPGSSGYKTILSLSQCEMQWTK